MTKQVFSQLESCPRCRKKEPYFFHPTVYHTEGGVTYMKCPKCKIKYRMYLQYAYVF